MSNDQLIEEYKTLRQEILEKFKRKDSFLIYTVIATATIFGFAIEFPSPYIFLLPLVIIIPLSYSTLGEEKGILHIGTYISLVIESKLKGLQWETYHYKRREPKEVKGSLKANILRQLSNYLLFDLLAALCLFTSFWHVTSLGTDVSLLFSEFDLSTLPEFMTENSLLLILWLITICYFLYWTWKMRNCYSGKNQTTYNELIYKTLNLKEDESTN